MAKNKIVAISGGDVTPYGTVADLKKRAPYAWSYYPTIDSLMENVAAMTCRQLVGKAASHAPDETMRTKPRKFALFLESESKMGGPMPGVQSTLGTLAGCGVRDPDVVYYPSGQTAQAELAAALNQMKQDGVTSVILFPFGGSGAPGSVLIAAQQVDFQPEWVTIGWNNYNTAFMLRDPPSQTSGVFGVGVWNKQPQLALEPWNQAIVSAGGSQFAATRPNGRAFYQELLLLASGIQMAGPDLTPDTFAAGLHGTTFPNPGAAAPPSYQGTVGFVGDDPVMVSDYTTFWLDSRTRGDEVPSSQGGNQSRAFCMVGLGRRWTVDTWPTRDGFYESGSCR